MMFINVMDSNQLTVPAQDETFIGVGGTCLSEGWYVFVHMQWIIISYVLLTVVMIWIFVMAVSLHGILL